MDSCPIRDEWLEQLLKLKAIAVPIPSPPTRCYWTPASTPPEKEGQYLVTYRDENIDVLYYQQDSRTIGGVLWQTEVIAWAPLPEPYRRE